MWSKLSSLIKNNISIQQFASSFQALYEHHQAKINSLLLLINHRFRFMRREGHNPERTRGRQKINMEAYTSLLSSALSLLMKKFYGKPITLADREMVDEKAGSMMEESIDNDIAFLVDGDPFRATTHSDLVVRAKKLGVNVEVVHNASVMNVVGSMVCSFTIYGFDPFLYRDLETR